MLPFCFSFPSFLLAMEGAGAYVKTKYTPQMVIVVTGVSIFEKKHTHTHTHTHTHIDYDVWSDLIRHQSLGQTSATAL